MKLWKPLTVKIIFVLMLLTVFSGWGAQGAQAEETGAGAKKPKNIALLPVENLELLAECGGDQYIRQQLERVVHVPLNGVTKMAAYIDPGTARRELASLVNSGRYVTKKNRPDYGAIMPALADKLGADLVILLRIRGAYEEFFPDGWGRTIIRAAVDMELLGFDRQEAGAAAAGKKGLPAGVIRQTAYGWINDEYYGRGLYELTEEAVDELLEKSHIRQRVFPVKVSKSEEKGTLSDTAKK